MHLTRVVIDNFRSISHLDCSFDDVTTFVGPNGAGKSTVLRALDWFFNGERGTLSEGDMHHGLKQASATVRIRVDFGGLTDDDRTTLGPKYAPAGADSFTVWRTWSIQDEKLTGKALAYAPFERIRGLGATPKRTEYNELRAASPELGLPACSSAAAVDIAMDEWERANPAELTGAEVSDTHLFGFNGQGILGELFDYVFVSADLRAPAETDDSRTSIMGKILQRAVDRSALDETVATLSAKHEAAVAEASEELLGEQLQELSVELTQEVESFARGRAVTLGAVPPTMKPQALKIEAKVTDGLVSTAVGYQGHGFQRTILLAALSVLSRRGRKVGNTGQMFLAIEEPELFQHPTQAKALASVLRGLAEDASQLTQVAYATHSPHFVASRSFDQVRRVTATRDVGEGCASTKISVATIEDVQSQLDGFVDSSSLMRRWEQVCLKYLPEALFADSVILVEGEEDAAVLEAAGDVNLLAVSGICVAPVCGKSNMLIPFTIRRTLGIPCLMVVDNDSGCEARMLADGRPAEKAAEGRSARSKENRLLCRYLQVEEDDFPVGALHSSLAFVPDTLESLLASDLPGWDLTRREVIKQGRGVDGKNAATYALATRECEEKPGPQLALLYETISSRAA